MNGPCPWHGDNTDLETDSSGPNCFWVVCAKPGCGCEGPYGETEEEAWEKWNKATPRPRGFEGWRDQLELLATLVADGDVDSVQATIEEMLDGFDDVLKTEAIIADGN